jgi:hypothetical protein
MIAILVFAVVASAGGCSSSGGGGPLDGGGGASMSSGTGGSRDAGSDGPADLAPDGPPAGDTGGTGGVGPDAAGASDAADARADGVDAVPAATFSQVWRTILTEGSLPSSPGCWFCHDGTPGIPEFTTQGLGYSTLVGQPSTSCPGRIRVIAGDAANSVLVNKLRAHAPFNSGMICGGMPMPLSATRFITPEQLAMIESWINAGALNN